MWIFLLAVAPFPPSLASLGELFDEISRGEFLLPAQSGEGQMYELKIVRERRPGYGRRRRIRRSQDLYEALKGYFSNLDREHFLVVVLDGKNTLLGFNLVSVGTLNSSLVHPREVFKPAILGNAAGVILMHNHPSGEPDPSGEDKAITKRLQEAGELLGIKVLDHIVAGDDRYFSFADAQLL